nr:molecular chaperone [Erwinia sorbitola]
MGVSTAGISLDRTRLILDGDSQSASANLTNTSQEIPFLAQSWVEDASGKKITAPLLVLPALQRINGNEKGVIRVTKTTGINALPQDRESLFYLNVREIPPKSTKANVLMLAMQSRIKLFYRPAAVIPKIKGQVWQDKIVFHKKEKMFIAENPTPYYITLIALTDETSPNQGNKLTSFSGVMISPKSSLDIPVTDSTVKGFKMMYVNDYGGHPEIRYGCDISLCKVLPADQQQK